ncbi:D-alanyl-D-alanine carboxypeptidase/D-alanyl-D-alanine-endopeptidase [Lysinibacillus halotolerans]|uniref:D-alanyl-D-alanine carboxypeptidase/D-alanyl-D-alanine-endopeptidase n=1 Tax=Lysinibacillus halotolerans TaxID=1368476 RepID=A0A3M8H722_9BACI|nr:D-alanyl-D-alanine carboxypeptidase/D-alanyl-D-alanine-endopeptidase [Lysinibacillus halotolerans]RNC98212.1 D-alanyl-D-alanine carboxypeptidase/D-alanyl-D-alanine-endopeptidase [Lysinibacillus halotolerans]
MKKKLLISIVALFLFLNHVPLVKASSLDNTVLNQLGNENISVSLRALNNGELLYDNNGDVAMKPASTLKLLTAAAALDMLGSDYRFRTEFSIHGNQKGNVFNGDVYIKGEGDPTLQKKDFITFASILKHHGIEQINGNLYGDDSLFVGEQLTPGISKEDESYYFAARTTALTLSPDNDYDAGTMIIHVTPTKVGGPPNIVADPKVSGMDIQNEAVTVQQNQRNTIEIERQYGTNKIIITGNIPVNTTFKDWVTFYDPTINTLQVLKTTLEEFGITLSNNTEIKRNKVPKDAQTIFVKHSLSLKSLMIPFLKLSNNSIADILVKTIGREVNGKGHLKEGIKALQEYGALLGLDMEQWTLEDGSGMSHNNRVSANELTHLLTNIQMEPQFNILYKSLPIGGQSDRLIGGSLKNRFNEGIYENRVIAKTGHITGVYTLAGYVKANSGKTYAFAIMTQHQTAVMLSAIDEVVKQIIKDY